MGWRCPIHLLISANHVTSFTVINYRTSTKSCNFYTKTHVDFLMLRTLSLGDVVHANACSLLIKCLRGSITGCSLRDGRCVIVRFCKLQLAAATISTSILQHQWDRSVRQISQRQSTKWVWWGGRAAAKWMGDQHGWSKRWLCADRATGSSTLVVHLLNLLRKSAWN